MLDVRNIVGVTRDPHLRTENRFRNPPGPELRLPLGHRSKVGKSKWKPYLAQERDKPYQARRRKGEMRLNTTLDYLMCDILVKSTRGLHMNQPSFSERIYKNAKIALNAVILWIGGPGIELQVFKACLLSYLTIFEKLDLSSILKTEKRELMECHHLDHLCQIHLVMGYQPTTFSSIFGLVLWYIPIRIYSHFWEYTNATNSRILSQKETGFSEIDFFHFKASRIDHFFHFVKRLILHPKHMRFRTPDQLDSNLEMRSDQASKKNYSDPLCAAQNQAQIPSLIAGIMIYDNSRKGNPCKKGLGGWDGDLKNLLRRKEERYNSLYWISLKLKWAGEKLQEGKNSFKAVLKPLGQTHGAVCTLDLIVALLPCGMSHAVACHPMCLVTLNGFLLFLLSLMEQFRFQGSLVLFKLRYFYTLKFLIQMGFTHLLVISLMIKEVTLNVELIGAVIFDDLLHQTQFFHADIFIQTLMLIISILYIFGRQNLQMICTFHCRIGGDSMAGKQLHCKKHVLAASRVHWRTCMVTRKPAQHGIINSQHASKMDNQSKGYLREKYPRLIGCPFSAYQFSKVKNIRKAGLKPSKILRVMYTTKEEGKSLLATKNTIYVAKKWVKTESPQDLTKTSIIPSKDSLLFTTQNSSIVNLITLDLQEHHHKIKSLFHQKKVTSFQTIKRICASCHRKIFNYALWFAQSFYQTILLDSKEKFIQAQILQTEIPPQLFSQEVALVGNLLLFWFVFLLNLFPSHHSDFFSDLLLDMSPLEDSQTSHNQEQIAKIQISLQSMIPLSLAIHLDLNMFKPRSPSCKRKNRRRLKKSLSISLEKSSLPLKPLFSSKRFI
ncbi:hypothetical protein VP01_2278g1 [Puccinia sorghi]|uniref:Uncharacterized protein n=1 Tax=Puccinia sorghi TaxID=27349 RepID=A0A0L6VA21_9BASI|nr:hypothetical protein VP01_2278g1 [Puccinia sorghi]